MSDHNRNVESRRAFLGIAGAAATVAIASRAEAQEQPAPPAQLPTLSANDFAIKGATDPTFLRTYSQDPLRLKERYIVDDALVNSLLNRESLLKSIQEERPDLLGQFKLNLKNIDAAGDFGDGFGDNGFKDTFKDGGGYSDRFKDNN